jgi:hypothetical protein
MERMTDTTKQATGLEHFDWTELLNEYAHRCGLLGIVLDTEVDALARARTAAAEVRIEINSRINKAFLALDPKARVRLGDMLSGDE